MSKPTFKEKFISERCCVIVPTYNNDGTLKRVLDGITEYTDNVIVVNDGATDTTATILAAYPHLSQVHFESNQGKGMALRRGFEKASADGYRYAITIDSDGQHFPSDLPVFIAEIEQQPVDEAVLLIGARNMRQAGIPKKSSFGNRFSNFWYWVETGIKLEDTQSGYRAYPLKALEGVKYFRTGFEFEIEVIVKAAWEGVEVRNIPVGIHYDQGERVTHFRPIHDFARISLLNTWLIISLIFYIGPRNLIRKLRGKGLKQFIKDDLLGTSDSPSKKSLSLALGLFVGLTPLWGLHTIIALGAATLFRLNKALTFAASNVSIPPMIPLIVIASLKIGSVITGDAVTIPTTFNLEDLKVFSHLKTYVIGSMILATVAACIIGSISFIYLKFKSSNISGT